MSEWQVCLRLRLTYHSMSMYPYFQSASFIIAKYSLIVVKKLNPFQKQRMRLFEQHLFIFLFRRKSQFTSITNLWFTCSNCSVCIQYTVVYPFNATVKLTNQYSYRGMEPWVWMMETPRTIPLWPPISEIKLRSELQQTTSLWDFKDNKFSRENGPVCRQSDLQNKPKAISVLSILFYRHQSAWLFLQKSKWFRIVKIEWRNCPSNVSHHSYSSWWLEYLYFS